MAISTRLRPTQVKAICLISLLIGHEAIRVDEITRAFGVLDGESTSKQDLASLGPESEWQAENSQCEFKIEKFDCGPRASAVPEGSCQKRCMPLDITSSSCCRLSDAYMLAADRSKYLKLSSGVLAAKADKFKKECASSPGGFLQARRCQRRVFQMMRSMMLLAKAQNKTHLASLTEHEKAEQIQLFRDSSKAISDALGDDGDLILELQGKVTRADGEMAVDPKGTAQKVMTLIQKLTAGTDAEKEEARTAIRAMPSTVPMLTEAEKQTRDDKLQHVSEALEAESSAGSVVRLLEDVDYFEASRASDVLTAPLAADESNNSLLQKSEAVLGDTNYKGLMKVGLAVVVVLLTLSLAMWLVGIVAEILVSLLIWAAISILGCAGKFALAKKSSLSVAGMKCAARVFTFPFRMVGRATRAAYNYLRHGRGSQPLQLGNMTQAFVNHAAM